MGSRDFISSLPDDVLGKILSLLWRNRTASTSVLSKRWRHLLAFVDILDLRDASGDHRFFCDFVDRTLALLCNSTTIKRFSLDCAFEHFSGGQLDSHCPREGLLGTYLEDCWPALDRHRILHAQLLNFSKSQLHGPYLIRWPIAYVSQPPLSFEIDKEKGWQVVPLLLSNSPNLETLVIKGLVHQVTDRCGDACACIPKRKKMEERVCCLYTCKVKVIFQGIEVLAES